ncbi:MAG: S9 family peptidase [Prevotella sp.]|nr:S9 family peptidase [Prevotella sp.]
MNKALIIFSLLMAVNSTKALAQTQEEFIGKNLITLDSDLMTPEALWAMGRIASAQSSPDGKKIVYQVGYYSKEQNKGHQVLYLMDSLGGEPTLLTTSCKSESDPQWIDSGKRIAYLFDGQLWSMAADGSDKKRLSKEDDEIEGFLFSPDFSRVILIKEIPYNDIIKKNPDDLPKATGRRIVDMNYRHWDEYVETIPHPFLCDVNSDGVSSPVDILEGEPYECPLKPFGGIEEISWSPDSKFIAYTCKQKTGIDYAVSTDSDIFLYNVETGEKTNLCKPNDYQEPKIDNSKTMEFQEVNSKENLKNNPGFDMNPEFSPDGKYIAWQSMARDGYESDRNRLCIYNLSTKQKTYVTESFDSNVDEFIWDKDSKTLYFLGVWHGLENLYKTNLDGKILQLTDGWYDYGWMHLLGSTGKLLAERHSMSEAPELFIVTPSNKEKASKVEQITFENKHLYDQMTFGKVRERWTKTIDGKDMQYWIILPSHFDEAKKYPTLLFCEGGPQSPVSQFWSYRWNMQIMAANGYVIIAPNRRGLPGFGSAWNEEISGDWTGLCMDDYLSAIDDAAENLSYVDKDRLGAVGASFGGFSVYYLASHHDGRFKCFIAHDGAFNLESMYTDTEEVWFSNWEYDDAYWNKDLTQDAKRTYENSPHKFIDAWDTPILCIHGEKDYRINANQGMGAFNAARIKGIPAELLLFPDENHWVLKPQNGILWQRTYFSWLDRWLK